MLQIIERLADDWHRLDERIEALSSEIAALADQDKGCERLMTVPGIGRSSQANGSCNRHWGCIRKRPRLQCLAWTGAETNLDRRPHHPRQYLKARQSLSARLVRPGRLGRVGQDRAKTLGAYGLKLLIEAAKKRLHHNLLAIALANKLARIAWAFFTRDALSSASKPMRQRRNLPDPRAVLGPVKAWPGNAGARRKTSATVSLDGPCARRVCAPAGRDEGTAARHGQRNSAKQKQGDGR